MCSDGQDNSGGCDRNVSDIVCLCGIAWDTSRSCPMVVAWEFQVSDTGQYSRYQEIPPLSSFAYKPKIKNSISLQWHQTFVSSKNGPCCNKNRRTRRLSGHKKLPQPLTRWRCFIKKTLNPRLAILKTLKLETLWILVDLRTFWFGIWNVGNNFLRRCPRNSKDQLAGCLGDPNANTVEVGDGFFSSHAWSEAECFEILDIGSTNDVSPRFTLHKTD